MLKSPALLSFSLPCYLYLHSYLALFHNILRILFLLLIVCSLIYCLFNCLLNYREFSIFSFIFLFPCFLSFFSICVCESVCVLFAITIYCNYNCKLLFSCLEKHFCPPPLNCVNKETVTFCMKFIQFISCFIIFACVVLNFNIVLLLPFILFIYLFYLFFEQLNPFSFSFSILLSVQLPCEV